MPIIPEGKIIERFNDSVIEVKNALNASARKDIASAQRNLERSATAVYQALEWTIKHVMLKQFDDPISHAKEIKIIEDPSFPAKLDFFAKHAVPFSPVRVNFKIIKDLKAPVRNQSEHSGFIPHFNSLREVILEADKIISNFLNRNAVLERIPESITAEPSNAGHWTEFVESCDSFDRDRNFVLIIGPRVEAYSDKLAPLGLIDWSMILDFDPNTQTDGLFKEASAEIESRRKVHLLTCLDPVTTFSTGKATYWIAANGLNGRTGTTSENFKEWSLKYSAFFTKLFSKYYASSGHQPTTVVVLWDSKQYILKVCENIYNTFVSTVKFVYVNNPVLDLSDVYDIYEGQTINLILPEISDGILKIRNFFNPTVAKELITLPAKDETYLELEMSDYLWIEEDLEVVHRNILDHVDFSESRQDFLKGKEISWVGLHMNFDVPRELAPQLKRTIEKTLEDRRTGLLTLTHYPGIGGTTLGRRVAWEMHTRFPVLILRGYRNQETTNRIYKVFELTKLTPLILADSSVVTHDEVERLLNEIRGRTFSATILLVQRNENASGLKGNFHLPSLLSDIEVKTFVEYYSKEAVEKKKFFESLIVDGNAKEKHPFYLGLIAFESNFLGLTDFVAKGLKEATDVQKKIVAQISLIYIYAQQALSAQLLTGLLMTDEKEIVRLEKHLPADLLYLLVNTEGISWQPIHYLVAQELLAQVLSGSAENKEIWRQNLPEVSIELIRTVSARSSITSESDMELIRRLFIYRDNQEILGKETNLFSTLIEDGLLSDEARLRIFKQLTDSFPTESHFWGHLARFYSFRIHNNDLALEAVTKAIELSSDDDDLLFHMKGMCLRGKVYGLTHYWKGNKSCPPEKLSEINSLVEESAESFRMCRELNPANEHGYVSHIQLIINSLDFSFSISKFSSRADFLRNLNYLNRQLLDDAEILLDQIKRINRNELENFYVKKCDYALQELYENYSLVIEGWNNLLTNKDVEKPPVRRQIIRAYLRRASSWDKISEKDIEKMLKLIEDNIQEEPKNENNIYLWFQCARQLSTIDTHTAIDKIANWRSNSNSLDATYYLAVLHSVQAINNTATSKPKAELLIKEASEKGRALPNRTYSFEWLGQGKGLRVLIPNSLATLRDENRDVSFRPDVLRRIKGKISKIKGPEGGTIELECGLSAFFVPAREGFVRDRDLNQDVNFYLGFSYDGLRAWDVEKLSLAR